MKGINAEKWMFVSRRYKIEGWFSCRYKNMHLFYSSHTAQKICSLMSFISKQGWLLKFRDNFDDAFYCNNVKGNI